MKHILVTSREVEAAYRLCLERERLRERDWRTTKQGAFESSFIHFDFEAEAAQERSNSASWLSDRGKGARQIRACDPVPQKPTRKQRINKARMTVMRHLPECLTTFWLVLKNGNNRKESICELAKRIKQGKIPNTGLQKPSILHSSKKS